MVVNNNQITIIKIGGKVIDQHLLLERFLKQLASIEGKKIIVHGGGNLVSDFLNSTGHPVKFIEGRRATDQKSLDVLLMNLAGLINKKLVAKMQALNMNAFGLSGVGGNLITAQKRSTKNCDYGYVGDVTNVKSQLLLALLNLGITPVVAPVTHNGQGQLLNTNADTLASVIAQEVSSQTADQVTLHFCFDLPFVCQSMDEPQARIGIIDMSGFHAYRACGKINGGMIPKLDNCFNALEKGVQAVTISDCAELINLLNNRMFNGTEAVL